MGNVHRELPGRMGGLVQDPVHQVFEHFVHIGHSAHMLGMSWIVDFHRKIGMKNQTLGRRLQTVEHVEYDVSLLPVVMEEGTST